MKNIKKEELDPKVFELYNDYAHNRVNRREFMQKLSLYAVGGLTVSSLMSFLTPNYKNAIQIKADDPRLDSRYITYQSPKGGGTIKGLLSMPKNATETLGGIIVVHENRGLNPHIEDVTRRAALAGFVSLAPDALSPLGGYPGNDDDGRVLQQKRNRDEMLEDFISAFDYLKKQPICNGKIGVVGFCFGGWISNMMAVRVPELSAVVPFYGGQAPVEEVPNINAPLLLQFAETDENVNKGWPVYEEALKANEKEYTAHFYPNTHHGFHNDTTPRYDKEAADLAWKRTVDFFNQTLK